MAKKSAHSEATGEELFTARSSPIRHINKQTSEADSSTVFAEAIANPAYRESASDEYLGILILSAFVDMQLSAPLTPHVGGAYSIAAQIQYGDQTGTPAVMDRDNQFLHMYAHKELSWASSVGWGQSELWPLPLRKIHPDDVIVTPEFTVVHDFGVNTAAYQSKPIECEIIYQIVEVPDKVFTRMLMDQTRTS